MISVFYLIVKFFAISSSSFPVLEDSEWAWVGRSLPNRSFLESVDPSIWVVFYKYIGSEKIYIRFPKDPQYHARVSGGWEVLSQEGEDHFSLRIDPVSVLEEDRKNLPSEKGGGEQGDTLERTYYDEGKWKHEKSIQSGSQTYKLCLESPYLQEKKARFFFDSFRVFP